MSDVLLFDRAAWAKPVAPSLARHHCLFLALCVGVLIYFMHHDLNVHTLVLHPTVAKI
jgi:hypothetical protein